MFPATRPIRIRLTEPAVAAAAVRSHLPATDVSRRKALDTAESWLTQCELWLDGGRLLLTSPRSHNRYTCTRTSCTCIAGAHSLTCWHRAAAAIVRAAWDAARPRYRCPHCAGPMVDATTYGGEPSVACLACGHERMPQTCDELKAWG